MAETLNLTPDQKTKVTAVFQTEASKRKEIRNDSTLTDDQKKEKAKALREDTTKQLKAILTADQFEKWQAMPRQGRGAGGPRQKRRASP